MREWWRRLRFAARREDGLSEEIRFHIERQTEKLIAAGVPADEARRQARVRFGGVEAIKDSTRDEFRPALLEDFWRDVTFGTRLLTRAPAFALIAISTLGLGIGAATAVFTVVDGVLLRPLPYPDPDRIVRVLQVNSNGQRTNSVSEPNFLDWKTGTRSFSAMAEVQPGQTPVSFGSEAALTPGATVSREFFDVMGVAPVVGRGFTADEQRVGGPAAAIISDRLWRNRFNGAPLDALSLRIAGVSFQVIGVMPPSFDYPVAADYWTARERNPPQTSRTAHNFQAVARVRSDVEVSAAHDEVSALSKAVKVRYGDGTWMFDGAAVSLRDHLTTASRPVLLILFGAAILLLAIACLNVSNLYLARAATRHRELALRLAIGASRWRIVRQLLAESLVLALAASALGTLIAFAGVRALVALQPPNLPRMSTVAVDGGVLAFALGVAVVTAVMLGLITAARTSPTRLREWLNEGQRTMAGGKGERTRQALVVAQVALTIVLLVGAGLLARSFARVLAVNPGYSTANALILDMTGTFPADPGARRRRLDNQRDILAAVERLPGVESAGLISGFPLGNAGNFANGRFLEMTRPDEIASMADVARLGDQAKVRAGFADWRIASAGYFRAMSIPLVRGRLFDESDGPDAPHVAVISESLARAKWPDQDPVGRFIQFGNMDGDLRGFRVIGVVGDVRELSPESVPSSTFYAHYRQRLSSRISLVARTAAPSSLAPAARRLAMDIEPEVPVQVRTIDDALDRAVAGRRFSLLLIAVFGGCALVLAALGVYGLMAYLVAQRTREIGIRLALGAESGDVLRMIVGRGLTLSLAGVMVGLFASIWLTGLLDGMLFGISRTDPIAFAGVLGITLAAVLIASYVPATRAMKVAPIEALRRE
jgi:putative ABC transport system permease protein